MKEQEISGEAEYLVTDDRFTVTVEKQIFKELVSEEEGTKIQNKNWIPPDALNKVYVKMLRSNQDIKELRLFQVTKATLFQESTNNHSSKMELDVTIHLIRQDQQSVSKLLLL